MRRKYDQPHHHYNNHSMSSYAAADPYHQRSSFVSTPPHTVNTLSTNAPWTVPRASVTLPPFHHHHHPSVVSPSVPHYGDHHHHHHQAPQSAYHLMQTSHESRKRQRRQSAGNFVSGLFGAGRQQQPATMMPAQQAPTLSGKAAPRKSTAQPRPSIRVMPRSIGPVYEPNDNDVLCGRGGRINGHIGNVKFRTMVADRKALYLSSKTKKLEKAHIAAQIVQHIRTLNPSGRFLKEEQDGSWFEIGDFKAIKKVGQALREEAQCVRQKEEEGEEGIAVKTKEDDQDHSGSGHASSSSSSDEEEEDNKTTKSQPDAKRKKTKKSSTEEEIKKDRESDSKSSPPGSPKSAGAGSAAAVSTASSPGGAASVVSAAAPPVVCSSSIATGVSKRGAKAGSAAKAKKTESSARDACEGSMDPPKRRAAGSMVTVRTSNNDAHRAAHHREEPSYRRPVAYQHLTPPPHFPVVPQPPATAHHHIHHHHVYPPQYGIHHHAPPQLHARPFGRPFGGSTSSGSGGGSIASGMRGRILPQGRAGGAALSGAAAEAMRSSWDHETQPATRGAKSPLPPLDIAFGRTFHPADAPNAAAAAAAQLNSGSQGESSVISGLSGPTSIMSDRISALTDPMTSSLTSGAGSPTAAGTDLSHFHILQQQHQQRMFQLQQWRQQLVASQQAQQMGNAGSDLSSASLGSSVQRSILLRAATVGAGSDLSWADEPIHSADTENRGVPPLSPTLLRTPIPAPRHLAANARCGSGGDADVHSPAESKKTSASSSSRSSGGRRSSSNASVAGSEATGGGESLPSVSASILSELSDNLVALDLAGGGSSAPAPAPQGAEP